MDFYDAITELYRIRLHSNLSAVPVTSLAALKPTITTKQKRHKNSDTLKLSRCETGLQASSNFQIRRSVLETSQMIDLKTLNSDHQFFHQRPTTRRVTDKATSKEAKGGLISRQEQSASSISVFEGSNNRHLNSEAAKRASSAQETRFSFVPRTSKWNRPAQGHWDFRWTPELTRRFSESKRRQRKPPFEIHTPQTQAQLRIPDREGHLSPRRTQRHAEKAQSTTPPRFLCGMAAKAAS